MEEDYEIMEKRIGSANDKIISRFTDHLKLKKLTDRTIQKHCSIISLYGNDYLLNYVEDTPLDKGALFISEFLDSWFIRKCMWADEASSKANITSLTKFYAWLLEDGRISKKDHSEFLSIIKNEKDGWIARVNKYNDPDTEFEDVFPEYF